MMKYYGCVSQYAVNRFLEPFMRSVRQWMTGTDTKLDQDCGDESLLCQHVRRALSSTCVNFNKKKEKGKKKKEEHEKKKKEKERTRKKKEKNMTVCHIML